MAAAQRPPKPFGTVVPMATDTEQAVRGLGERTGRGDGSGSYEPRSP
jgi:hypothetical protein